MGDHVVPSPREAGWLLIEPLLTEEACAAVIPPDEYARIAAIPSPARRREMLSWRALLYGKMGHIPISYAPCGAPELPAGRGYIGVSHSHTHVALCWSPAAPCAIDIEDEGRNFAKVASRYLTPGEQVLNLHPAWLCIAWSAKECLYKLARRRELDLLRDLQLLEVEFEGDHAGKIIGRLLDRRHTLHFRRVACDWVVWSR